MRVQSQDDLPPNAVRCLRCFPTGVECVRFYSLLFFSFVAVVVAVVVLLVRGHDCAMTTLISTTIAFWLSPPTIDTVGPVERGGVNLSERRAPPKKSNV